MLIEKRPLGTIAYLGQGTVPEPFCWSMIQLVQFCNEYLCKSGEYVHPDHATLSGQILMRNALVTRMQGDWIFFIDSDHNFDPDLLYRLLMLFEGHNKNKEKLDVLGGMYQFKEAPHAPVAWMYHEATDSLRQIAQWDRTQPLMPVDCLGAGCLLIRRTAIERLVEHYNDLPFNPIGKYNTDDFDFFERCRRIGIVSWWAPRIEVQHMRWQGVKLEDYKPELIIVPDPTKTVEAKV
jgi:hypothetical protein